METSFLAFQRAPLSSLAYRKYTHFHSQEIMHRLSFPPRIYLSQKIAFHNGPSCQFFGKPLAFMTEVVSRLLLHPSPAIPFASTNQAVEPIRLVVCHIS